MSPNTTPTDASAPFDHPKADIIIRSSDQVDFRMFIFLLSIASPVFEVTFELPQPQLPSPKCNTITSDHDANFKDGLPVVQLTEDSKTLYIFLGHCLPITMANAPEMKTLEEVTAMLEVTTKYEAQRLKDHARQVLLIPSFMETPVRVYAIACRFRLVKEAMKAAKETLRHPLLGIPDVKEMEYITARGFARLQDYHTRCGAAAQAFVESTGWLDRARRMAVAEAHDYHHKQEQCRGYKDDLRIPRWWPAYAEEMAPRVRVIPHHMGLAMSSYLREEIRRIYDGCAACEMMSSVAISQLNIEFPTAVNAFNRTLLVTLDLGFDED